MPLAMRIEGSAQLRKAAAEFRKAEKVDMRRELRKAVKATFVGLEPAVKKSAAASLPKAGGYAVIMSRAVKVTVKVRTTGDVGATARIHARGRAELRDVRSINAGRLRHPVFGNRKNWTTTNVRPGFVDRPVDDIPDKALRETADAVDRVIRDLARLG